MRFPRFFALLALSSLLLAACTGAPVNESQGSVIEIEKTNVAPGQRDQLVTHLEISDRLIGTNSSLELGISISSRAPLTGKPIWSTLRLARGVDVRPLASPNWRCEEPVNSLADVSLTCVADADRSAAAMAEGLNLLVDSGATQGVFGIAAFSGYGDPKLAESNWESAAGKVSAAKTFVKVVQGIDPKKLQVPGIQPLAIPSEVSASTVGYQTKILSQPFEPVRPLAITSDALASFCALYALIGVSGGSLTAGPVQFSNLDNSSTSGLFCNSNSSINLTSAKVSIGSATFTNVQGTITPAQISLTTSVADGEVLLTIAGPYPDTGSAFSATAVLGVGAEQIAVSGTVDYSSSKQFTVALDATASGLSWSPLPGFTVANGGVSGTFTRAISSSSTVDSFQLAMNLTGDWNPASDIHMGSLGVSISNQSGDLVGKFSGTADGSITSAELNLSLSNLLVDGTVDFDSGDVAIGIQLAALKIGSLATINQAQLILNHSPKKGSGADSAQITGTASFNSAISGFAGSEQVTVNVDLNDDGYLLSADLESTPSVPGFALTSLQLVYASLDDPTQVSNFAPNYPGVSGVLIPLENNAPLAVAVTRGLPAAISSALSHLNIGLIDPAATSVIAIELPPGEPKFSLYYDAPEQPYLIGSAASQTYLRFDDVYLSLAAGATDDFTIGGSATLHVSDTDLLLDSDLEISVSDSGVDIDGDLELIDEKGWDNAFGLSGLTVFDLLIQAGLDDGAPSFGIRAVATLPANVSAALGIDSRAITTLGLDVSAANPCAVIEITPGTGSSNILSLDAGALTANYAEMILAPDGCLLGQDSYTGFAFNFDGVIRDTKVGFETTFETSPSFSLEGSGYIGSFPMGSVTMEQTTANLSIDQSGFQMELAGGLNAGSSVVANGKALLTSNGGFSFDGEGKVFINGNGADVSVHASDCLDIACTQLTDPMFDLDGMVSVSGFTFDAAIESNALGNFDAKLTIPNQTHEFSFTNSNPKLSGKGEVKYTLSVEVSDTSTSGVDFSGSVKLKSCSVEIVVPLNCSGAKVSWNDSVTTGKVDLSVSIEYAGKSFRSKLEL